MSKMSNLNATFLSHSKAFKRFALKICDSCWDVLMFQVIKHWEAEKKKSGGAVNVSGSFNPPLRDLEAHQNRPWCFQRLSHHLQHYISVGSAPHKRSFRRSSRSPERDRNNTHTRPCLHFSIELKVYMDQNVSWSARGGVRAWMLSHSKYPSLKPPWLFELMVTLEKPETKVWERGCE